MQLVSKEGIHSTVEGFCRVVAQADDASINQSPFEGSWSLGQVAGHLLTSLTRIKIFLAKNTGPCERAADEKLSRIEAFLGDTTKKMKNPDFTEPPVKQYEREEILAAFRKVEADMIWAVETLELDRICKSAELPGFGPFTRLEWLSFFLLHIQRHTRQAEAILEKLS